MKIKSYRKLLSNLDKREFKGPEYFSHSYRFLTYEGLGVKVYERIKIDEHSA